MSKMIRWSLLGVAGWLSTVSGVKEKLFQFPSKIFNPNFTTKSSGTGLGLAICKAIVENAGGKIWFTTSTGEGTTFYVKLPAVN